MKALKAFIKPFEAPQRSVKVKISVNFFLRPELGQGWVKTILFLRTIHWQIVLFKRFAKVYFL